MVHMTIPSSSSNLSESDGRMVTLEVTGICNPNLVRTGSCTMTVPYSRLSQTLQRVHRLNGKVASVTLASLGVATPVIAAAAPAAPSPRASEPAPAKDRSPKSKRKQKG